MIIICQVGYHINVLLSIFDWSFIYSHLYRYNNTPICWFSRNTCWGCPLFMHTENKTTTFTLNEGTQYGTRYLCVTWCECSRQHIEKREYSYDLTAVNEWLWILEYIYNLKIHVEFQSIASKWCGIYYILYIISSYWRSKYNKFDSFMPSNQWYI